jgi:hypothetical protein
MFAYFGNGNLSVKDLKYPSYERFISMFYHSFKLMDLPILHSPFIQLFSIQPSLPFTLKKAKKGRPLEGLGFRP